MDRKESYKKSKKSKTFLSRTIHKGKRGNSNIEKWNKKIKLEKGNENKDLFGENSGNNINIGADLESGLPIMSDQSKITLAVSTISEDIASTSNTVQTLPQEQVQLSYIQQWGDKDDTLLEGRRIVDIKYFIDQLYAINRHSEQFQCSLNDMTVTKEIRNGLESQIFMICRMCNYKCKLKTSDSTDSQTLNLNLSAVNGIMSIGCGYSHLDEFLSTLVVPNMSSNKYNKDQQVIPL
ncbi:hypothetical protein RN001_012234 [Aquatica leii]|uniref:Mutator-like transposase domain-containing protein n=1 Tax=Aquatica leii TaxID=1421715 RepID=A0AAN7PU49_9COLE|nr:hypothetical protein RN001_012234 [Aquatica leii]